MSNIQVIVRCRGRTPREVESKSPVVVDVPADAHAPPAVTVNAEQHLAAFLTLMHSKTYTVDQVYGPQLDQALIHARVVQPLVRDFLRGLNVTILAYGQTGTGKTYTMCGDCLEAGGLSEGAGVIPRVLSEMFDALEAPDASGAPAAADYVVRCLFVELYNEELRDLLGDAKLRIYEQASSITIHNLQQACVCDRGGGLALLRRGLLRRRTAATKLNDVSSRLHTIFTISLYRRGDGDSADLVRVSKMNLVDLAGSENISRSGAVSQRAKEAGSINQSLLALGRVINCLSDREAKPQRDAHIPYRESKLTRLLQDSLGGLTKTALIATISPARVNIEETTSTLEYASRAKNIHNRPQLGHDLMLKRVLVRDMAKEIARLNADLAAARTKNGVWLDEANYHDMVQSHAVVETDLKEQREAAQGLQAKVAALQGVRQQHEANLKRMSDAVETARQECDAARQSQQRLGQQNERYHREMAALADKLHALGGRHASLTTWLNDRVNPTVQLSVAALSEVVAALADTSHSHTRQFSALRDSLAQTLEALAAAADSMERQVQLTIEAVPQLLQPLRDESAAFSTTLETRTEATQAQLEHTARDHEQFGAQLLGLWVPEAKIDELVEAKLAERLQAVNAELAQLLQQAAQAHFERLGAVVVKSLKEVLRQVSAHEREVVQRAHAQWLTQWRHSSAQLLQGNQQLLAEGRAYTAQHAAALDAASLRVAAATRQCVEPGLQAMAAALTAAIADQVQELRASVTGANETSGIRLRNLQNDLEAVLRALPRALPRAPLRPRQSPASSPKKITQIPQLAPDHKRRRLAQ